MLYVIEIGKWIAFIYIKEDMYIETDTSSRSSTLEQFVISLRLLFGIIIRNYSLFVYVKRSMIILMIMTQLIYNNNNNNKKKVPVEGGRAAPIFHDANMYPWSMPSLGSFSFGRSLSNLLTSP